MNIHQTCRKPVAISFQPRSHVYHKKHETYEINGIIIKLWHIINGIINH